MSLTHAYAGYNTAGGSTETMTTLKVYAKKITLASAGWIGSIGAWVKSDGASHVGSFSVALFEDNAGTPRYLLAYSGVTATDLLIETSAGVTAARWLHRPLGYYATAADYWIAVMDAAGGAGRTVIHKDGSGSDRTYTSGGAWAADWGFYSPTTTTDKYSIRASVLS